MSGLFAAITAIGLSAMDEWDSDCKRNSLAMASQELGPDASEEDLERRANEIYDEFQEMVGFDKLVS